MQRSFEHTPSLMLVLKYVDLGASETSKTRGDLERLTSLGTTLSCIVYGAHAALYFVAMKYMFHTSSLLTPQNRLWLILSTLLLLNATTNLALQVRWGWNVERMLEGSDSAFNLARVTLFMTMNWISDSILLFRFFAITGRKFTTMILPSAMILSSIAVSSTFVQEIAAAYTSYWSNASNTPIIVYLSLSCGLNLYLTTHIVCHMVQFNPKVSTSRTLCNRIAALFVQSAFLYLVPTVIFIVLCAQRSLGQNLLFPIVCQIQPLSPLLVIMRVAQGRFLSKESAVITAEEILSAPAHRRPRLSLKLDFRPHNTSDIEGGEKSPETPMAPTTPKLPEPLPFVKIKSDLPSAVEMLDSEKMNGLWKSQDSRRVSWSISPSPSTPSYLPTYTPGKDLRADDPLSEVNNYNRSPEPSPSDTFHPL